MCANNDRPLLGLVTLMTAEANLNAGGLMPLKRGQPPPPFIQGHVSPREAVHGVYRSGGRGEGFVRPCHKKIIETTAVDQPLLQAYRPARGRCAVRSCASVIPVSLCTGEAFHPRE